jgi:hypothetical protein
MNFTSLSAEADFEYDSCPWFDSAVIPKVRYRLIRISVARRIELTKRIREIGRKLEFLSASSDAREKLEAAVLSAEIDRAYLEWGLADITGLAIDGESAGPAEVIERGPPGLTTEILASIKSECGLNDVEREN